MPGYQRHIGWDMPDTVLSKPLLGLNPVPRFRYGIAVPSGAGPEVWGEHAVRDSWL